MVIFHSYVRLPEGSRCSVVPPSSLCKKCLWHAILIQLGVQDPPGHAMPRVTAVWYGQVRPTGFVVNVPTNLISMAGRKFTQQIWVSSYIVLQKDLRVRTLLTFLSRTASDATASALAAMLCEAAERMVATASGVNSSDFTCTCTSRTSVVQMHKSSRHQTKDWVQCKGRPWKGWINMFQPYQPYILY